MRRKTKKETAALGVRRDGHVDAQLSADCHRQSWSVEPDDKDGFKVFVGSAGRIRLTQHPPFGNEVEIVLHPDEARRLLEILPLAVDEAEFLRHGGPTFDE